MMEVISYVADEVDSSDGELMVLARSAMPFLNIVIRAEPGGDADALLARARDFFFARRRGFVTYAWPGDPDMEPAALAAGMTTVIDRYPEMVCRAPLDQVAGDVREVAGVDDARAYWDVCEAAYPSLGFPPGVFAEAYVPEDLLDKPNIAACLAWDGDTPVAGAGVWLAQGVAMVGWVAVVPEARGRGLAAACTVWATNRGFEMGADVASLQASPMGESLYARLGYEYLFDYRIFGAMPPAAG